MLNIDGDMSEDELDLDDTDPELQDLADLEAGDELDLDDFGDTLTPADPDDELFG